MADRRGSEPLEAARGRGWPGAVRWGWSGAGLQSWEDAGHDGGVNELDRRRWLEELFAEHAEAVRAYALRRIDVAAADDTVSEVFVVAWRRLEDVPGDALPWLLACARRVLANQRRGVERQRAGAARLRAQRPPGFLEHGPAGDLPLRSLANLSERDREVLLLTAWEDLAPAQAAAALECSRATTRVRS
jgi:RNA polymerase sigma-70 factor, ECF subfamily